MHRSRVTGGRSNVQKEKLVSKLLTRVVQELRARGTDPTPAMVDQAKKDLDFCWDSHQGKLSDKDLKKIVSGVIGTQRSRSQMEAPRREEVQPVPHQNPPRAATVTPPTQDTHADTSFVDTVTLLKNTTRKQREMIADSEWSAAAEADRINGIEGKRQDRQDNVDFMTRQRRILDEQIGEHNEQKRRDWEARMQTQRDMDDHIENHRRLTRQEKQAAHDKAMREKQFREQQQRELDARRERERQEEHDEQLKFSLMISEEMRKQKENDLNRKMQQKEEWRRTLEDNLQKQKEKEIDKLRRGEEDKMFQRLYSEREEQLERERAADYARKDARAAYFQKLANGVASMFMAKQQDQTDKIENEYNEQLRRALDDENSRKKALKDRTMDCRRVQQQQLEELRQQREREREDARRLAQAMRDQGAEARRQEEARKMAQKAEADRMKNFLNTQLQMAHFKETQAPETSIARPASRAKSMYSPSRYTPSPKPDVLLR